MRVLAAGVVGHLGEALVRTLRELRREVVGLPKLVKRRDLYPETHAWNPISSRNLRRIGRPVRAPFLSSREVIRRVVRHRALDRLGRRQHPQREAHRLGLQITLSHAVRIATAAPPGTDGQEGE